MSITLTPSQRQDAVAVALGGAAALANYLSALFIVDTPVPVGTMLIFIAAQTLGVRGCLLCANLAMLGALVDPAIGGEVAIGRGAAIGCAIAFMTQRYPRLFAYPVTIGFWGLVLLPIELLFRSSFLWRFQSTDHAFIGAFFLDSVTALCAGALLLNPSIWLSLTRRPRPFSLSSVLVHVVGLTSLLSMGVIALLSEPTADLIGTIGRSLPPSALLVVALSIVAAPILIGYRLTLVIARASREMLSIPLLTHSRPHGFSGLSSDFWRRKSLSGETRPGATATEIEQKRYGPLGDLAQYGVCAVDPSGTITFANRRFSKLTGVRDESIINRKIDAIGLPSSLLGHLLELMRESAEKGEQTTEFRLNELPSNLRYFEIRALRAAEMESSSLGSPDGVIFTLQDITDRRAIENTLLRSQRLSALGTLITGIAHSFNNALTSIAGHASLAATTPEPEVQRSSLEEILHTSKEASSWIHHLLDYAQGAPGALQEYDLSTLLSERLPLLRDLVGEKIEISLTTGELPCGLRCDPNLVFQAVTNLVQNSRESYRDGDGRVVISVEREEIDSAVSTLHIGARSGSFVRLRVRDFGAGMSAEVLARAFDPLFSTKRSTGGTGLGLSTVFAITRAHDGFLTAESELGGGTTISLYFPLVELGDTRTVTPAERQAPEEPEVKSGVGRSVLVVEDEKVVRDLIERILTKAGYSVATCGEGMSALQRCREKQFDVVIVDLVMPKMDGGRFLAELRSSSGTPPKTLLMTGYGTTSGMDESEVILAKPFDMTTLCQAVEHALKEDDSPAPPSK